MLPRWMMALLVLLRERWSARRDAQVSFLRLQLEITRSRLPGNRVGNRLLSAHGSAALRNAEIDAGSIRCQRWVGGLLKHCCREAA